MQVDATFDSMKLKEDLLKGIYAYGTPALLVAAAMPAVGAQHQ